MNLTAAELYHILDCIQQAHGLSMGYAEDPRVSKIQGKLSIMLDVAMTRSPMKPDERIPFPGRRQ